MNRPLVLETHMIFAVVGLIVFQLTGRIESLYVSFAFLVIGLFVKGLAWKIAKGWLKIGMAMGFVVSHVLLSLLFFLFLTPMAILYRISNRKKRGIKVSKKYKSYYVERNHVFGSKDLEKPW